MYRQTDALSAFEARFIPEPNSGCWLWIGYYYGHGCGGFQFANAGIRLSKASRVAWALYRGPIPDGLCVLHRCDNPACVNPDHLFLGTNADNMADKMAKGRQAKGERLNRANLTEDHVRAIHADTRTYREIAGDYRIGQTAVCEIKRGVWWKHLGLPFAGRR